MQIESYLQIPILASDETGAVIFSQPLIGLEYRKLIVNSCTSYDKPQIPFIFHYLVVAVQDFSAMPKISPGRP